MVDCSHLNGEIVVGRVSEGYYAMVFGSQGQQVYRSDWSGVPPYHAPFATYAEAYQWGYDWAVSHGYPDPPIPPVGCELVCTEGAFRSPITCWDGSIIYAEECVNDAWVPSGEVCPELPVCNEGEYIEPIDCPDGSVIYAKVCQGGQWVDSGYVCPTQPSGDNKILLIGGGLAVAALVVFLALRK